MVDDNGTTLTSYKDIQKYSLHFFKTLYSKIACENDLQIYFLSFLQNGLSDLDRDMLSSPIIAEEIYEIIKYMALNKTTGVDGLPTEFYL